MTNESRVPGSGRNRSPDRSVWWLIAFLAAATVATGVVAMFVGDNTPPDENRLSPRFDYSLSKWEKVDPALVGYEEMARFAVDLQPARAVAVGPGDSIQVVGGRSLVVLSPEGKPLEKIDLEEAPLCLAVDADGKRYVGFVNRVVVLGADGSREAAWKELEARSRLASIAIGGDDVFVADAGMRRVLRHDKKGKVLNELAGGIDKGNMPSLVIPSPYFDVAVGTDGLVRVVNPGRHLIEFFTSEGRYESPLSWGTVGLRIESFCGCCNPAAIALLGDDRIVTAEKGIPRAKVYSADGKFECVVATPEQLGATGAALDETRTEHKLEPVDLAVDGKGRILVLDPSAHCVRVFVKKKGASGSETARTSDKKEVAETDE
jgi:hypothetical protein